MDIRDKNMLYYYQKHGENLESDPPSYGCLHPKWQKQHKDKLLSKEDLSKLWQIEQCCMEPINPKTSHHMTSLDKWTVSLCSLAVIEHLCIGRKSDIVHVIAGLVPPASPRRFV